MKQFYLLLCICLGTNSIIKAEETNHFVNAGIGFPNIGKSFFNLYQNQTNFKSTGTGPLHLKYEYRLKSWLGVGLSINHATYHVSFTKDFLDTSLGRLIPNKFNINSNNTAINLRFNIHLIHPDKESKFDPYFGFGIGYKTGKLTVQSDYDDGTKLELPSLSHLGLEATLGCRYFIDENLGVYSELGLAKSIIQIGMAFRF